ncbi:MAG: sugar phosphate isomerase/epimerase [Clostridiales bacterium]|nr:sugar phosphate isomerase/epimerase [Clostridiales bacterium]
MSIGISTSCFYPLETEKSLRKIAENNVGTAEIFFNTSSELKGKLLDELVSIRDEYKMTISSVHTFLGFGESYLAFSEYYRRFLDTLDFYKYFFEACGRLGATICVFHGEKEPFHISGEEYIERVGMIAEEGRRSGVILTQENVVRFRSQSDVFLKKMRDGLGDLFKMTFDIKQAVRSGLSPLSLAEEFAGDIVNIHISDNTKHRDCLPPLSGDFDFGALFDIMKKAGYAGNYMIELYRRNFKDESELFDSYNELSKIFEAKKYRAK